MELENIVFYGGLKFDEGGTSKRDNTRPYLMTPEELLTGRKPKKTFSESLGEYVIEPFLSGVDYLAKRGYFGQRLKGFFERVEKAAKEIE